MKVVLLHTLRSQPFTVSAPRLKVWIYPATLTHTTGPRTTGLGGVKPTADLVGRGPEATGEKSSGEP